MRTEKAAPPAGTNWAPETPGPVEWTRKKPRNWEEKIIPLYRITAMNAFTLELVVSYASRGTYRDAQY